MTQDRTDMVVLRGAPDVQDVTPKQRACAHDADRFGFYQRREQMCATCHLWIDPEDET